MKTWRLLTIVALSWGAASGCDTELPNPAAYPADSVADAADASPTDAHKGEHAGDERNVIGESDIPLDDPEDTGPPDAEVPDADILDVQPDSAPDADTPDAELIPDAQPDVTPDADTPDADIIPDAQPDAAPDAQPDVPELDPCGPNGVPTIVRFWKGQRDRERARVLIFVDDEDATGRVVINATSRETAQEFQFQSCDVDIWYEGAEVRAEGVNHRLVVYDPGRQFPDWPRNVDPVIYRSGEIFSRDEQRVLRYNIVTP